MSDKTTDDAAISEAGASRLSIALVCVALVVAVIGSLGAPLITPVATGLHVSLNAAQWTLTVTLFSGAIAGPLLGRLGSGSLRRLVILVCLAIVVIGGALTTLPLPFPLLLIGRGLQGVGLGGVPLLMSVARAHLPAEKSASTIATLSVVSTVGIGVGYPVIGLLDQLAGLRAAYGLGLVLSIAALVIAWLVLPKEAPGPRPGIDWPGALLLCLGTLGALLVIAEPSTWNRPWVGASILVITVVFLTAWAAVELRTSVPLVNLRLLGQPAVLRANLAMIVAGIGMYLLFSLLTRYLQTPSGAPYGFGLPGVASGAALIPFSALGFVAGKALPGLIARISNRWAYLVSAAAVMLAAAVFAATLFAATSGSLIAVLVAMAVLGLGVGGISAAMPSLVLTGVPPAETASVLAINQIVRSIGFSIGSALAGLLLATATPAGGLLPTRQGYITATLWALLPLGLSGLVILIGGRRTPR
ncbi:MFS transporter [Saxibacter everestensis]|uniref:MFS transporter n=1 Tax=Saxibacter everestensis TaxID=2909229 RepID=A0ABY8QV61_9MICO|nr:MFS transporter [Brevibacteriaceae bacterium ZFBP1038]